MEALARLQLLLEFHNTKLGPQFETPHSLGRMGVGGLVIGAFLGAHACLLGFGLGDMARGAALGALTQWALYGVALSYYHYCVFCGYNVLPFLEHTALLVYPIALIMLVTPLAILVGFNPTKFVLGIYFH